ncbi:Flp family type IVb pilin [Streptomyces sp. NRRL F-5135]|uniref:Flp family type IVb pilin n=1 Tax=Streptomyces sp. NRRL F-5135 TaxID=1463858 RepID=UPI0004C70A5A|nr:hypothetical protein [Streptomyces sp. NRRL F-5135]
MSVISPARNTSTINYHHLPAPQQNLFDQLMAQADNTASAAEYEALMAALIAITGITGVRYNEILKCACPCDCGCIFDADAPGLRTVEEPQGYNLGRLQCPTCTDEHPTPDAD